MKITDIEEHPEERECRLESEKWAAKAISEFAVQHHNELVWLIQIYPDSKAHALLRDLREKFWSMPKGDA